MTLAGFGVGMINDHWRMKNSKGTKRLVSGIPRVNDGCQQFAFFNFHFSFFIS
jgi:hypothetical protein